MLYPHEIIHAIFTRKPDQFKKSFVGVDGDAGLVEFWSKQSGAHWVQSHPGFVDHEIKPECAISLGFHSDKGVHTKSDKILTMAWNRVMTSENTEWAKLLFTILPDDLAIPTVSAEELHSIFLYGAHTFC